MGEIRHTEIKVGSNTILTCWDGDVDYELNQMILIGLEGWDTYGTEISTERKLFGAGSYVVDKHLPERVVSLEIAEFNELSGLKASLDALKSIIKDFEEVRIIRTYEANGGTRTEELRGIVRAITDYEIIYDDFRRVGIEILCPDPTMIINGVIPPTPEEPESACRRRF